MTAGIHSLILNCDLLGHEAKLYSSKGRLRHLSLFGGILSILMVALILAGSLVFTYHFFNRDQLTIISNEIQNKDVSYKGLSGIPLMFRISGSGSKIFEDSEKIWRMKLSVATFNSSVSSTQSFASFPMERCSLEKHVDIKYRDLFLHDNFTSIDSYFCPNFNNTNIDLNGQYGSSKQYNYITVVVEPCIKSLKYTNCKSETEVRSVLSGSYIDFTTITYKINHENIIPQTPELFSERIGISSTIFKRIWFEYQQTIYSTDSGYIFEEISSQIFNQAVGFSQESDFKDVSASSFLWFTIINNKLTKSYQRSFMKAQTLLSNIGGIISGLHFIGVALTYIVCLNIYSVELIKRLVRSELKTHPNSSDIHLYVSKIPTSKLKIDLSNMSSAQVLQISDNNSKNEKKVDKNYYSPLRMLLPYFCWCNSKQRKVFAEAKSKVKEILSIFEVMTRLQKYDLLFDLILEEPHKVLIGHLLNKEESDSQLIECVNKIQIKPEKSLIDRNILGWQLSMFAAS